MINTKMLPPALGDRCAVPTKLFDKEEYWQQVSSRIGYGDCWPHNVGQPRIWELAPPVLLVESLARCASFTETICEIFYCYDQAHPQFCPASHFGLRSEKHHNLGVMTWELTGFYIKSVEEGIQLARRLLIPNSTLSWHSQIIEVTSHFPMPPSEEWCEIG